MFIGTSHMMSRLISPRISDRISDRNESMDGRAVGCSMPSATTRISDLCDAQPPTWRPMFLSPKMRPNTTSVSSSAFHWRGSLGVSIISPSFHDS